MKPDAARSLNVRVVFSDVTAVLALALPVVVAVSRGASVPGLVWAGACVVGVLAFAPFLDPKQRVTWDQKPLPGARLGIAVLCSIGAIFQIRSQGPEGSEHVEDLVWVLALGVLGNAMPALQPNWFFGVRTPWTLRDDEVWRQTHRVAGHLLLATSALLAGLWWLLKREHFQIALIGISVTVAVALVVYSWWLSKRTPTE